MITSGRYGPAVGSAFALALLLAGCGGQIDPTENAFTSPTRETHFAFPVDSGPHAVDCDVCHGAYSTFRQFDCLGCHVKSPTDAVHTTTPSYLYQSPSCFDCHEDPSARPFDHKGTLPSCAACHGAGAFYAALPVPGFTHPDTQGADCGGCHGTSTWSSVAAPSSLVSDPDAAVVLTALVPRYADRSVASVTATPETLTMSMSHSTPQVEQAGVSCAACHVTASAGVFFPGRLHSSLANLGLPQPVACSDCHAGVAPTGFVGPLATHPPRSPPSGEMKHDAVAWSGASPTGTRLVTFDCGVCHAAPSDGSAGTWAVGRSGAGPALYHEALASARLPQPTSCLDCHASSRPAGVLDSATADLPAGLTFDHAATDARGDCSACHAGTTTWAGGRRHPAGSANPASCLPCHEGERPTSTSGWTSASYTASPFDYVTNTSGVPHGAGLDCALCHKGPGTGGTWGGTQTFAGGHLDHATAPAAGTSCVVCHSTQRPDLVLGRTAAAAALQGFDHAVNGTGDCLSCHRATVVAGTYVNYLAPGGAFPGGDWKGGVGYPGDTLCSVPGRSVTVTSIQLIRSSPGSLVTGTTSTTLTLPNAMLHVSAAIPAQVAPGPAATPDPSTCWHCHAHDAAGNVTAFANGTFHAALAGYSPTVGGSVSPLPQPTALCGDCHGQMLPAGIVERSGSDLQPMDHGAQFTGPSTIGGRTVTGVAGLDCSTCHLSPGGAWSDGTFHARIGSAVPADCVACHYPLMADAPRADVASGTTFVMSHRSGQITFQACEVCHPSALAASAPSPYLATDWKPGAYHGKLSAQPSACLACHAVSEPAAGAPTQSSWSYLLRAGATTTNGGQWMNHGARDVVGVDCATCHAADARTSGSAWSKDRLFHSAVAAPRTCRDCHGLTNGNGTVPGTRNNMPAGLTDSSTLTSASANPQTGVPAGTHDQITHSDVNVTGHDCSFCHTQAGRSSVGGVQGFEWAQSRFHASFSAGAPLVINGTTGRCSNCHLNVRPGAAFTALDHRTFTSAAGTQDCSACHSWPGTGSAAAPNWLGASGTPPFITVGGFAVSQPPAPSPTTQTGIANLPHPTVGASTSCATCHPGGVGGKRATGYDHASTLGTRCSACHEAGSNLVGTGWNGATAQASGAGDTRPFTLTTLKAHKGSPTGSSCNINVPNHFYAVDCYQCHTTPSGTGAVTTGTAYSNAWRFPHQQSRMTNPGTCNLCHVGQGCSK
jgi:hypothetical protein